MSVGRHIDVDVLVVGLGPAGASAARAAAAAGARVLAIERNREPGLPVQCAEFIPMMLGGEVDDLDASRVQRIDRMETFVGAESKDVTVNFLGFMVDRAQFDRQLIGRAAAAGAVCLFGTRLRDFSASGAVTVGHDATVMARVIIGADGPRSPVGKAIDCVNTELVETRQITVDLLARHAGTDIFLRPEFVGGYGWLFPKGGVCNVGLGVVPERKQRLKPLLNALHRQLVAEGRVGETISRVTGGLIPVGGMVGPTGRIAEIDVLLAGDAAGLTNPVTGAGINAAVISGRMAGETAARIIAGDGSAANDYREDLEDMFGASLRLAVRRRRELLSRYQGDDLPDPSALRRSWIAYPQYWTN
ncbi:MAG: NAD(P)/FAD-dependent oxidoreductase [Devosia sp.]|nr:NAD(P)/FAD-dependent oxidoreductase [Devosia sp.]